MQVIKTSEAAVTAGINNTAGMKANLTGVSFNHILDSLYSDPVRSVVREIITNALEANMLSKTDKKVVIQVPDALDSNLIVRDYGPGLSKEGVEKYLNCLFSTSKDSSNEFIGGFGLGAKSPLALTDSFTVISIHNGMKYEYVWFRERGKIPNLVLLSEEKTDLESGLIYNVPCDQYINTQKWISSITEQLFLFKDKLCVVTELNYEFKYEDLILKKDATTQFPDLIFSSEQFSLYKSQNSYNNYYFSIGGIVYSTDRRMRLTGVNHLQFTCVIHAGIGEFELPMSREYIISSQANAALMDSYIETIHPQVEEYFYTQKNTILKNSNTFTELVNNVNEYKKTNNLDLSSLFPFKNTVLKLFLEEANISSFTCATLDLFTFQTYDLKTLFFKISKTLSYTTNFSKAVGPDTVLILNNNSLSTKASITKLFNKIEHSSYGVNTFVVVSKETMHQDDLNLLTFLAKFKNSAVKILVKDVDVIRKELKSVNIKPRTPTGQRDYMAGITTSLYSGTTNQSSRSSNQIRYLQDKNGINIPFNVKDYIVNKYDKNLYKFIVDDTSNPKVDFDPKFKQFLFEYLSQPNHTSKIVSSIDEIKFVTEACQLLQFPLPIRDNYVFIQMPEVRCPKIKQQLINEGYTVVDNMTVYIEDYRSYLVEIFHKHIYTKLHKQFANFTSTYANFHIHLNNISSNLYNDFMETVDDLNITIPVQNYGVFHADCILQLALLYKLEPTLEDVLSKLETKWEEVIYKHIDRLIDNGTILDKIDEFPRQFSNKILRHLISRAKNSK